MKVWASKSFAKKNGLLMEEWLTELRARLYKKCKVLKSKKLIKDCHTQDGEVFAVLLPKPGIVIKVGLIRNKYFKEQF